MNYAVIEKMTWQEQYDLGMRYLIEGNYSEAIVAFTSAIEIDPKIAPAYVGRGDTYFAIESHDATGIELSRDEVLICAEEDYLAAIEIDKNHCIN